MRFFLDTRPAVLDWTCLQTCSGHLQCDYRCHWRSKLLKHNMPCSTLQYWRCVSVKGPKILSCLQFNMEELETSSCGPCFTHISTPLSPRRRTAVEHIPLLLHLPKSDSSGWCSHMLVIFHLGHHFSDKLYRCCNQIWTSIKNTKETIVSLASPTREPWGDGLNKGYRWWSTST